MLSFFFCWQHLWKFISMFWNISSQSWQTSTFSNTDQRSCQAVRKSWWVWLSVSLLFLLFYFVFLWYVLNMGGSLVSKCGCLTNNSVVPTYTWRVHIKIRNLILAYLLIAEALRIIGNLTIVFCPISYVLMTTWDNLRYAWSLILFSTSCLSINLFCVAWSDSARTHPKSNDIW